MPLDRDEKIIRWCISVVLVIFAIINGFKIASLILILAAVIAMPIKPITDFMLNLKPMVAVVVSLALILVGVITMPDSTISAGGINKYPTADNKPVVDNTGEEDKNDSQTSPENNTDNTGGSESTETPDTTPTPDTDVGTEDNKDDEQNNTPPENVTADYVLNTSTLKFHLDSCYMVKRMDDKNKEYYSGSRDYLIKEGYAPCGHCDP